MGSEPEIADGGRVMRISRFDCASSSLRLKLLLSRTRTVSWICLGLGLAMHVSLTQIRGLQAQQKPIKPLATQFIKRQPRLNKPLELKKRPQPKRRTVQREMVTVRAKVRRDRRRLAIKPVQVVRSLVRPKVSVLREQRLGAASIEPRALAESVASTRETALQIDVSLEMMDMEALDTGQYQAMVIQDPNDRRCIKGYLHLAIAFPFSVRSYVAYEEGVLVMEAVRRLVGKLNEWTDINASVTKQVGFDSAELFQTPWTFLFIDYGLDPIELEVENLGKYLLRGGFFFFEGYSVQTLWPSFVGVFAHTSWKVRTYA